MKPNSGPRPNNPLNDDSDLEFEIDNLERAKTPQAEKSQKIATYTKIGSFALAVALTAAAVSTKAHTAKADDAPVITFETPTSPVITFGTASPATEMPPAVEITPVVETTPTTEITPVVEMPPTMEVTSPTPEVALPTPEVTPVPEPTAQANIAELQAIIEAETIVPLTSTWEGETLNAVNGKINGPSGEETYYNLPMDHIVERMRRLGNEDPYWIREDGVKMLGPYVMVAANLKAHPRGSIVETSLGTGIVCDTGDFAKNHPNRLDLATNW